MKFWHAKPSALPVLAAARQRRWRQAVALLAGLALVVAVSGPAYHRVKRWRALGLAAEAERFLATEQAPQAAVKAQAAFELAPAEPAVLRAMARLCIYGQLSVACDYWQAFLNAGAVTPADRREAAQAALHFQQLGLAQAQLEALLKIDPTEPETLELAVQLALQAGDRPAALEYTRRWLARQPGNAGGRLMRAQLLFTSPEPAQRAEGKAALHALSMEPARQALPALLTLATDPGLSREEALSLAQAVQNYAEATPEQRLTAIALEGRAAPERRTALLEEAVARYRAGAPEVRAALGRWLEQQGEPARVLELFPAAEALTRQDFFLIRIDALSALHRWPEIQAVLGGEKVPLEPFYREVFLARAAQELHEERGAEAHWGAALLAARPRPELLIYLAQYAGRLGAATVEEKAWWQLSRTSAFAARADRALVPILDAQGRTRELRDLLQQLCRLVPADPAPRNDVAYLDLLLGENVAAATRAAEQLVHDSPQTLAYRNTLALARLRTNDPAAAARAYEGVDAPWEQLPAPVQAVWLATLLANHETDGARTKLAAIPLATLKPEERALLDPAEH